METIERVPAFTRDISKETRAWVLERNGYTCQMCGVAAGDPDPLGGNQTIRLTMGHILDKSKGGDDTPQNLRAVCTNCNQGLQNTALPKPNRIHLLAQIRRRFRIRTPYWTGCFKSSSWKPRRRNKDKNKPIETFSSQQHTITPLPAFTDL